MEEKEVFVDPEITTYDRAELDLETAVTKPVGSEVFSDRRLKENFRAVDFGRILEGLLQL